MADLANNIRLAVDSGEVAIGVNEVMHSVKKNAAKMIIVASNNKSEILQDIQHVSKVSNIRLIPFEGNTVELGAVCGKPYSVSVLSIIKEGNSKILEEEKEKA